jgi:hypothetical protein
MYMDELLASRESPKTICPSEIARALSQEQLDAVGAPSWGELMPEIRNMVAEMQRSGCGRGDTERCVLKGELGEGLVEVKGLIRVRRVT